MEVLRKRNQHGGGSEKNAAATLNAINELKSLKVKLGWLENAGTEFTGFVGAPGEQTMRRLLFLSSRWPPLTPKFNSDDERYHQALPYLPNGNTQDRRLQQDDMQQLRNKILLQVREED